jgi:two-component system nitrogen regulation response regulator GlnG/two-component system response regulator HydG
MSDKQTHTLTEVDLPWDRARRAGDGDVLHLVVAWSLDEPDRVGEVAAMTEEMILGRGGAQPEDALPRVRFHRQRPGVSEPTAHLASARISRAQLRVAPTRDGRLSVVSIGRRPLVFREAEVSDAIVDVGEVFSLKNALMLLVVRRPRRLPPLRAYPSPELAFGAADAYGIVGESPTAWALRDELAVAARGTHHVLVQGESGAGKELCARAIHGLSARAGKVFVSRNAATFPEGLVDAELFGSAKNYPNPGSPDRPGLIGEADGGTLFLDEIGELPQGSQAHLLRVLDAGGEYQRLGESKVRRADLRLVAATNRELDALKHDFAARFVARLQVPGLDERKEDVPLLIRHVIARFRETSPELMAAFFDEQESATRIEPRLVERLLQHSYTHHMRELERLLWLSVTTSRSGFLALTPQVATELTTQSHKAAAQEIDADRIRAALAEHDGSVTAAAKALGLASRFVLYRLMKRHGIKIGDGE